MAITKKIDLGDNRDWYITVGLHPEPVLEIPISQLDGILDSESIKTLVRYWAQYCIAEELAYNINSLGTLNRRHTTYKQAREWAAELRPFVNDSKVISRVFSKLSIFLEEDRSLESRRRVKEPKSGWVYILSGDGYYKIGKTTQLDERVKQISPKLPFEPELVCAIEISDITKLETTLHEKYADCRTNGEWFELSDNDVEWLKDLANAYSGNQA